MNQYLIICGPTASGKTALALHLAKKFNGELISADSRQVYRGMDIGTGKDLPVKSTLKEPHGKRGLKLRIKNEIFNYGYYIIKGIPVWLLDLARPDQEFTVAHFHELAQQTIKDILDRGKLPIIVGGTGFYLRSLIRPFSSLAIPPNKKLRRKFEAISVHELSALLEVSEPDKFLRLNNSDKYNSRRLIRALEIADYHKKHPNVMKQAPGMSMDVLVIGLTIPMDALSKLIDRRINLRVKAGIICEIEKLLENGYSWFLPSLSAIGYRQWRAYFEKTSSLKRVIKEWQRDEYAYAKRQMVWFKKDQSIVWFTPLEIDFREKVTRRVQQWYTGKQKNIYASKN